MATIKSFTDLEQSKVLAKILPHESADMYYGYMKDKAHFLPYSDTEVKALCTPCWSLAVLLDVIRKTIGYTLCGVNNVYISCELGDFKKIETEVVYDNEVDACVEMIENLHDLDML